MEKIRVPFPHIILGLVVIAALFLAGSYDLALFNLLAEILSVIITVSIFLFVWNARKYIDNNYLIVIGVSVMFIAFLDLLRILCFNAYG